MLRQIEKKYATANGEFSPVRFTNLVTEILIVLSDPNLGTSDLGDVLVFVSELADASNWFEALRNHTLEVVNARRTNVFVEPESSIDDTREHVYTRQEWDEIQANGDRLDETQPVFPPAKYFFESNEI